MAQRSLLAVKLVAFVSCSIPLAWLVLKGLGAADLSLGANPVETVLHSLGTTALNLLLIGLAVTPLRRLTGLNMLVRLRRMLGLFCFFYLVLHFLSYALLDLQLAWETLFVDITQRPYISVGMLALVAMIPLAATSTQAMQRRLGRRWGQLHRMIYPISVLAVTHFIWQTKADLFEPLVYSSILAALLGYRIVRWLGNRRRRSQSKQALA